MLSPNLNINSDFAQPVHPEKLCNIPYIPKNKLNYTTNIVVRSWIVLLAAGSKMPKSLITEMARLSKF